MGKTIIIDVRTNKEFCNGHVENAILVETPSDNPSSIKEFKKKLDVGIKEEGGTKKSVILVYCRKGIRAENAVKVLKILGYKYANSIGGVEENPLKKYIKDGKYKLCNCCK